MKVLFVASELYPWQIGGPQNVVYNLANHLAERIDLEMLCISPGEGQGMREYYRREITFNLIEDRGPKWFKYLHRNISYVENFRELDAFDLVHFHILPGANCFFLPPCIKKRSLAKLVLSLYDWVPEELRFYGTAEKLGHIMHWSAARRRFRYFDRFVVNSTYVKEIAQSYGLGQVEIMPNGIDMDEWRTSEKLPLKGGVNILYWGRLYAKKGVGRLIRAFAESLIGRDDVHLYIGGEGPEENLYRDLSRSLGLEDKVTFLGMLTNEELKRYLNSCDFCVFPSVYEGFGISILEAMAASKPVITSRKGGQTDFARDGYNALLVDLDEPQGLARAIKEMIDDTGMRESLGANAASTATRYDWRRIAQDYAGFYERILEGN